MFQSIQSVLVEGSSKKDIKKLYGRTENNRIVTFSGPSKLIGQLVNLKINKIHTHSLQGELF